MSGDEDTSRGDERLGVCVKLTPRQRLQIALAGHMSIQSIRRWEKDPGQVSESTRLRIQAALETLGVTLDEICDLKASAP